jgi:hypothetical protein
MLAVYRRQIEGDFLGAILMLNVANAVRGISDWYVQLAAGVLGVAAIALSVIGSRAWALAKGQPGAWGICGVVAPIGWVALGALNDKARAAGFPDATFHVALKRAGKSEAAGDFGRALLHFTAIADAARKCSESIRVSQNGAPSDAAALRRAANRQDAEYQEVAAEATSSLNAVQAKANAVQDDEPTHESPENVTLAVRPSTLATGAAYFSLIVLFGSGVPGVPMLAPVALLLGWLALRDLRRNPDKYGRPRAWVALSAGAIGALFLVGSLS